MNFNHVQKLPDEIKIGINLADTDPDETIYIFENTPLYYEIKSEIGEVERIVCTLNGQSTEINKDYGYILVERNDFVAGEIKELKLDIHIKANNKSLLDMLGGGYYTSSVTYKIKYVSITVEDFARIEQDIDKVVFSMINPQEGNYRLIVKGREIHDHSHIIIPLNSYPQTETLRIHVLPPTGDINNYEWYKFIELSYPFPVFEGIPNGSYPKFYYDASRSFLYVLADRLYVYDKSIHLISTVASSSDIWDLAVTPVTGKVVCSAYGECTVYSDFTLSTIISRIEDHFFKFCVNAKDQLFHINNSQIDVFDLNTGLLLYSFVTRSTPWNMTVSHDGEYLYITTGDEGELYRLTDDSATLIHLHPNRFNTCKFHPVHPHHLILSSPMGNFEIFDIDSKETILAVNGEFQTVDPITGTLLYYNENYWDNYGNTFLNASYEKVFSWENSSRGFYSDFSLFNDYLIKYIYYSNISHKLVTR